MFGSTEKVAHSLPIKTVGIIGGGQLGKMLTLKAKEMGLRIIALDKDPSCPVSSICDELIVGSLYDKEKLLELAKKSDVVTYEIEHTDTETLKCIEQEGINILPSPALLELINDKLKQKVHLISHGIPTSKLICEVSKEETVAYKSKRNQLPQFPLVQKARKGGYDGRGVAVIRNENDLHKVLETDSFFEEFIEIEKEIAVLVARDLEGNVESYPVVEMVFDSRSNILDMLISPARIPEEISEKAKRIAFDVINSFVLSNLKAVGVFAIEMFLTKSGDILVNEIAPRVHNSGHHTIESCYTSQFEQHLRAIAGLPLGSTKQHSPAVMINLLGEPGYYGKPAIVGLEEILRTDGAYLHWYGKSTTGPFRKMGHVTIIDESLDSAIGKAKRLKDSVKIISEGSE
ncbi:5-(carboxyamino)imidazole ribonucleotide synthase [Fervidobacterium islandicum]|uniref:5-(carboxyamino)imidazole ribonucleotide synthase n=1 Tax=Fervidobacterium islandicum TaxID=2423 RepID=UPI003A77B7DF